MKNLIINRVQFYRILPLALKLAPIALIMLTSSCKKESAVSSGTISLLQNKWTLISSSVIFPTNSTLNSTYKGISSDYYLFEQNDSLKIRQAGQVSLLAMPLSLSTKYAFIDNNTISYGPNPAFPVSIKILTTQLLVLTNTASASFINVDYSVTTYTGTKTDSLRR